MIYDLEYLLKFDRSFKRPIHWSTELMYPVALWLFHRPSERRRQIYCLIGQLVCLPARYRAWNRKITTYGSSTLGMKLSKRALLFAEDPNCFWCGRVTVLQTTKPIRNDNVATIEHLYSRLHPKRKEHSQLVVLACFGCNMARSHAENSGVHFTPQRADRVDMAREVCATLANAAPPLSDENHPKPSPKY